LISADVLTHTTSQNPTLPAEAFSIFLRESAGATALPKLGEGRVFISPRAEARLLYSDATNTWHDFVGKRLALWSNLNLLEKVPKVNGSSTLQLREQAEVQRLLYASTNRIGRGLVDFLGVSHFSSPQNPTAWTPRDSFCPMVTCGQQPVFAGTDAALEALAGDDFDPRRVVYLDLADRSRVSVTNRTDARILDARFSAHQLAFGVEAKEPSLIVVAQSFAHSWQAKVDGKPTPLLRANHAFQAFEGPAGLHQVTLVYRDQKFLAGGMISLGTLAGCIWFWLRSRRHPGGDPGLTRPGSNRASLDQVQKDNQEQEVSY
jgi:hypothetical protein